MQRSLTAWSRALWIGLACTFMTGTARAAHDARDAILFWMTQQQLGEAAPSTNTPGNTAAAFAAMHNAANATNGAVFASVGPAVPRSSARPDVAVAYAAHRLLTQIYPARAGALDQALAEATAGLPEQIRSAAQDVGVAAAESVLAARQGLGPNAPWLIPSANAFRPAPPPAVASDAYLTDYNYVKDYGRIDSAVRTAEQQALADFWNKGGSPFAFVMRIVGELGYERIFDEAQFARFMAAAALGIADATAGALEAKLFYNTPRPITAIRNGDGDANPLTVGDATWTAYGVNIPPGALLSYPSGGGAIAGFLAAFVPAALACDAINEAFLSGDGSARAFTSIESLFLELGESRVLVGEHFPFDVAGGLSIGEGAADYYLENALPAVQAFGRRHDDGDRYGALPTCGVALHRE